MDSNKDPVGEVVRKGMSVCEVTENMVSNGIECGEELTKAI